MKKKCIIPLLIVLALLVLPGSMVFGNDERNFYYDLGVSHYDKGKIDEAISAWEIAIIVNPEFAAAYYNLGNAYEEKGLLKEAVSAWEKVIEITPFDIDVYFNMGVTYTKRGMFREAAKISKKAIKINPEDPEKVYFACYDSDLKIPATGYRMDRVRSNLEERNAKNVIVLADTCHAGKLITRGDRGLSIVPIIKKMSREQKVPKGWIFMVGADTDRQAIEDTSWANGAFTHSLIKGLSGKADGFQSAGAKDGIVTMGELKAYMNTAMPDETQKVLGVAKRPVITTNTGDPDIWNLTLQAK